MHSLPPEDLDESYDTTRLLKALRKRIAGLSRADAQRRLQEDHRELLGWLNTHRDHPGWFVAAYIAEENVVDLIGSHFAGTTPDGVPIPTVHVPTGYTLRREPSTLFLKKRSTTIAIIPLTISDFDSNQQMFTGKLGIKLLPFRYGDVSGEFFSSPETGRNETTYLFRVGGIAIFCQFVSTHALEDALVSEVIRGIRFERVGA